MNTDQIIELISSALTGNASPEEKRFIEQWINESEENKALFTEIKMLWEQSMGTPASFEADTDKAWDKVAQATGLTEDTKVRSIQTSQSNRNLFLRIAAAVLILLGLSSIIIFNINSKPSTIEYSSNAHEVIEIKLPDGSTAWLNENSTLSYIKNFKGDTRELELKGEAYFEVAKNPDKAFIIHTDNRYTKVLGTSFNVRAYDPTLPVEVFVNTGKVELGVDDTNESLILEKGNKGIATTTGELVKTTIDNENFMAWKTKLLVFSDVTLSMVFETIESYFNIEVDANGEIMNCHFTGSFNDPDLQNVMDVISLSTGITYTIENNTLLVRGVPCEMHE